MEAYDNHLLSSFFSLPAFQNQFGEVVRVPGKKVSHELNPAWQSGLGMSSPYSLGHLLTDITAMGKLVGMIIGVQINPYIVNLFGCESPAPQERAILELIRDFHRQETGSHMPSFDGRSDLPFIFRQKQRHHPPRRVFLQHTVRKHQCVDS